MSQNIMEKVQKMAKEQAQSNGSSNAMYVPYRPSVSPGVCPNCGYCPSCGRPYGLSPMQPYYSTGILCGTSGGAGGGSCC